MPVGLESKLGCGVVQHLCAQVALVHKKIPRGTPKTKQQNGELTSCRWLARLGWLPVRKNARAGILFQFFRAKLLQHLRLKLVLSEMTPLRRKRIAPASLRWATCTPQVQAIVHRRRVSTTVQLWPGSIRVCVPAQCHNHTQLEYNECIQKAPRWQKNVS